MELKIRIKNIRSIRETTLYLKRGLNILIGPNGSGKTCTLFALKFLRDLIMYGAAQAVAKGGGKNRVYHRGEEVIEFEIVHDYGIRTYRRKKVPLSFRWYIQVSQGGTDKMPIISKEYFIIFETENYNSLFKIEIDRNKYCEPKFSYFLCPSTEFGRDLFMVWHRIFRSGNKNNLSHELIVNLTELLNTVSQDSELPVFSYLISLDIEIRKVHDFLTRVYEYNIIPELARISVEQLPFAYMKPNGEGVAEVIYNLEKKYFNRIKKASSRNYEKRNIFDFQNGNSLFEPLSSSDYYDYAGTSDDLTNALEIIKRELSSGVSIIDNISTQIDPNSGKIYVIFKSGEQIFLPEEVSDGTIKWLCILVSIYVPFSRIYLLEEPENFLHPWMQQRLISNMREQSQEKEIIYLLTSHSATVLNAAEPQEIMVVTSSLEKGTTVNELSDREEIEELLQSSNFRLGDLWVSGMIAGVPGDE